jgi:hypothetical protein
MIFSNKEIIFFINLLGYNDQILENFQDLKKICYL